MLPNGRVVKPHIRDTERMQGFDADWTKPAEEVSRPGYRWKLVGNAVTVNVAEWLGERLGSPRVYDSSRDEPLKEGSRWPKAAWNVDGQRMISGVSEFPASKNSPPITEFLNDEPQLLSPKATSGFLSRARSDRCNLRWPTGFLETLDRHLASLPPPAATRSRASNPTTLARMKRQKRSDTKPE